MLRQGCLLGIAGRQRLGALGGGCWRGVMDGGASEQPSGCPADTSQAARLSRLVGSPILVGLASGQ